jgi:hypothetical protein
VIEDEDISQLGLDLNNYLAPDFTPTKPTARPTSVAIETGQLLFRHAFDKPFAGMPFQKSRVRCITGGLLR